MIIGIDFDGTCVTHEFPDIGRDIGAVPVLQELVYNGHQLILFTMRSDRDDGSLHLSEAVDWFKTNGISLYGIQRNPTQDSWTSSPKAYAQLYIDDAGFGCPLTITLPDGSMYDGRPFVNWELAHETLTDMGIINERK